MAELGCDQTRYSIEIYIDSVILAWDMTKQIGLVISIDSTVETELGSLTSYNRINSSNSTPLEGKKRNISVDLKEYSFFVTGNNSTSS